MSIISPHDQLFQLILEKPGVIFAKLHFLCNMEMGPKARAIYLNKFFQTSAM
jgi:hypothetical protein